MVNRFFAKTVVLGVASLAFGFVFVFENKKTFGLELRTSQSGCTNYRRPDKLEQYLVGCEDPTDRDSFFDLKVEHGSLRISWNKIQRFRYIIVDRVCVAKIISRSRAEKTVRFKGKIVSLVVEIPVEGQKRCRIEL